mgnify:CR=1 FL=1
MRPLYLLFGGLLLCFDAISLFNAARPNSDSRLNGVWGRYLYVSGLEYPQVLSYSRRPACG